MTVWTDLEYKIYTVWVKSGMTKLYSNIHTITF